MNNYIICIQYDGTSYNGWQVQNNSANTIQGLLQNTLSKELNYPIHIIASGRTDAGVHALRQYANFHYPNIINYNDFLYSLNKQLPDDIRILSCKKVHNKFHSRYDAKNKTYTYTICNDEHIDVFTRKYSYHIIEPLNTEQMIKASKIFIGTHDFTNFTNDQSNKSKIRTISNITINTTMKNKSRIITISYTGNGFLYNMIRILTGTLVDIGLDKLSINDIQYLLSKSNIRKRHLSGAMLPAKGLCLENVSYKTKGITQRN